MIYPTKDCKYDVGVWCQNFHEIDGRLMELEGMNHGVVTDGGAGNSFAINGTVESPFSAYKLYGKSVQDGVPTPDNPQPIVSVGEKLASGKNLLDDSNFRNIVLKTAYYNLPFHIPSAGTYTFSLNITGGTEQGLTFGFRSSDNADVKQVSVKSENQTTFTLSEDEFSQISFINIYTWSGSTNATLHWIMLNKGSTALPYEPYTGDKKAVYDVGIGNEICGKNLLDNISSLEIFDLVGDGSILRYGRSFEGGKTYTVTNQSGELRFIRLPSSDFSDRGSTISIEHNASVNVTVDSNHILWFFCNQYAISTMDNCMVAVGSDVSYSPYTGQSHTLNRTLRAIPVTDSTLANYTDESGQMWCADTIEEIDGKMCLVERVGEVVLDGDESFSLYTETATGEDRFTIYAAFSDNTLALTGVAPICTHFEGILEANRGVTNVAYNNDVNLTLSTETGTYASADEFEVWVKSQYDAGTPIRYNYILATPIITELTAEEVSAIESLHSYDGVTTVMSDAWAEVECLVDTKSYIDNKFAELAAKLGV